MSFFVFFCFCVYCYALKRLQTGKGGKENTKKGGKAKKEGEIRRRDSPVMARFSFHFIFKRAKKKKRKKKKKREGRVERLTAPVDLIRMQIESI